SDTGPQTERNHCQHAGGLGSPRESRKKLVHPLRRVPTYMSTTIPAALQAKANEARQRLDAHVREIVAWHFNPETGAPFWLEKAKSLGFNPREEVKGFEDLKKFGLF